MPTLRHFLPYLSLGLAGCIPVLSEQPLATPATAIVDSSIAGRWVGVKQSTESWEPSSNLVFDARNGSSMSQVAQSRTFTWRVCPFRIGSRWFIDMELMDVTPAYPDSSKNVFAELRGLHMVQRVKLDGLKRRLETIPFDTDQFEPQRDLNPIRVHAVERQIVEIEQLELKLPVLTDNGGTIRRFLGYVPDSLFREGMKWDRVP